VQGQHHRGREPDGDAVAIIARGAARLATVPDDETAAAMRLMLGATHNLTELAGALNLAVLMRARDLQRGRRVGVVLSGGNVDASALAEVLAGRTPAP
jgi:threonine dehydratase